MDGMQKKDRDIKQLVEELCKIILIKGDTPDYQAAENYVCNLTTAEKVILNENSTDECKQSVLEIVQRELCLYIGEFDSPNEVGAPFEFDSANNYQTFRRIFQEAYRRESKSSACPPAVFEYIFISIKSSSDQFRLFEKFFANSRAHLLDMMEKRTREFAEISIKELAEQAAQQAADQAARIASESAQKNAEAAQKNAEAAQKNAEAAQKTAEEAKIDVKVAERQAEEAAEKAKDSVRAEIPYVIKEASEHSVAILGIFAGIVLAVVAGLFYSSSVLESLYNTNIFKVLCVSSLVGLICIYLLALMFYYIDKLGGSKYSFDVLFAKIKYISIVLISIMLISGFLYFFVPEKGLEQQNSQSDMNISGELNVSIDEKETLPLDEIKPETQTDTTTNTETDGNIE